MSPHSAAPSIAAENADPASTRSAPLHRADPAAGLPGGKPSAAIRPTVLHMANRAADALGLFRQPLSVPEMMSRATRDTGLADFGDPSFEQPLQVLVSSLEDEADLSPFGRLAARWDTQRFLQNLLMLREAEKRTPALLDERIVRPIFITGLPRSGSTFLHHLFSKDPANLVVRCWETIAPFPGAEGATDTHESRVRRVDRQLARFRRLAPEFGGLHPMTAESPQECTEITAHVFQSLRFDTTHAVPSYLRWLDAAGHLAAYRFHQRFLRYLQHRKGPRQWILKCPDHVFALDAIRTVYPDARFVFTHRNPLEVLPSVARLTEVLRWPFTRHVDRSRIGRQVSDRWAEGAAVLTEAVSGAAGSVDGIVNLRFRSFIGDPVGSIAMIYERLGLSFSREAELRIRSFIAERPNGGYGNNRSKLQDFALDEGLEQHRYRDYIAQFGV